MGSMKLSVRLNRQEQQIIEQLGATWAKNGKAVTPSGVVRLALLMAENHRRRSNGLPQLKGIPGDDGSGDARQGRPPKTATSSSCS